LGEVDPKSDAPVDPFASAFGVTSTQLTGVHQPSQERLEVDLAPKVAVGRLVFDPTAWTWISACCSSFWRTRPDWTLVDYA
jgi:hypothetical protein